MANNIPHFDDVIVIYDEDEEDAINSEVIRSKRKRLISSTGSIENFKKVKRPLDMLLKPSDQTGKNLVGTPRT